MESHYYITFIFYNKISVIDYQTRSDTVHVLFGLILMNQMITNELVFIS